MNLEWIDSGLTKYVAATVVGYMIALLANVTAHAIANRRSRRVLRESLAEEVLSNLIALDEIAEISSKNLLVDGRSRQFTIPNARLSTVVLTQCTSPSLSSLLSEGERLQAGSALIQAGIVNQRIDQIRELLWSSVNKAPVYGQYGIRRGQAECRHVVDQILPPVGQTHTDLLCQVLSRQLTFDSSRLLGVATTLKPVVSKGWPNTPRIWRTGVAAPGTLGSGFHIVWNNDAPDALSPNAIVIELKPSRTSDRILHRSGLGDTRMPNWLRKRRHESLLRKGERRLSSTGNNNPIAVRSLSTSILSSHHHPPKDASVD